MDQTTSNKPHSISMAMIPPIESFQSVEELLYPLLKRKHPTDRPIHYNHTTSPCLCSCVLHNNTTQASAARGPTELRYLYRIISPPSTTIVCPFTNDV